ncbi:unnamed protein product, partial [Medioppia subpectinata]
DQITIFGESAGSWSVSAHILSPLSKGIFKRAIMESGAHMYNKDRDVVNKTEALSQAKAIAKGLKCNETEDWIQCLRRADAKDILKCETQFPINPLFETEFLPITAQQAFDEKKFNTRCDVKTMGICHMMDLPFVFGLPLLDPHHYTPEDILFSNVVMKLWTNFATNGHTDSNWPQLLNDDPMGTPKVHGLDPTNLTLLLKDPFHQTCDGVWAHYFL